ANRLCINLHYQGRSRVIEPYSLRQTRDGNLLLYGLHAGTWETRAYRVDQIQGLEVTKQVFIPKFAVEFSGSGLLFARPTASAPVRPRPSVRPSRSGHGPTYVIECLTCSKHFYHQQRNTTLRRHKDRDGWPCPGRRGSVVDVR